MSEAAGVDRHRRPAPREAVADPNRALRVRAAWIYHVEGRTQSEVAKILGLNRVAVTRLLSDARRRGEVTVTINAEIAPLVSLQRRLEQQYGLDEAIVAPLGDGEEDATQVIAAAAGRLIGELVGHGMTVGVGWGRTLHAALPYIEGRSLNDLKVVSLLGGIAQARRFNPAEFAWQFAERFDGEGFLVPAPALVDSPRTRHALLEFCGLKDIFAMAEASDVAIISAGGISNAAISYRAGQMGEDERAALQEAGAVGDVLYNFVDAQGRLVDHPINSRVISIELERLAKVPRKIFVSGGPEKVAVMRAALISLSPTSLVTDEATALALLAS